MYVVSIVQNPSYSGGACATLKGVLKIQGSIGNTPEGTNPGRVRLTVGADVANVEVL